MFTICSTNRPSLAKSERAESGRKTLNKKNYLLRTFIISSTLLPFASHFCNVLYTLVICSTLLWQFAPFNIISTFTIISTLTICSTPS